MSEYEMCHKPVGDDQDHTKIGNHMVCGDEWCMRYENYKCVVCGKNERLDLTVCSTCNNNNSDYEGYEELDND